MTSAEDSLRKDAPLLQVPNGLRHRLCVELRVSARPEGQGPSVSFYIPSGRFQLQAAENARL